MMEADEEERRRRRRRRQQAALEEIIKALVHCTSVSKARFERRKTAMTALVAGIHQGLVEGAPSKTTWVRDMLMDHTDKWETTVFPQYDDGQFWKDFRCTKATFEWLCFSIFQPCGFEGNRSGPNWRVISLRRRVAMLLWRLLHGGREHAIARIFFCDQSTVNKIVHKGLGILAKQWTDVYITWPTGKRADDIAAKFELLSGLSGVVGALDGSHIPITTPSVNRSDYYNDKSFHSMILMAAADPDGFFLDIDAGLYGSLHDSQALATSRIAPRAAEQPRGLYLVGDAAFNPPKPWLMCPFKEPATPAQEAFNQALSTARTCVEQAICQLKSRFRVLLKKMEGDLDTTVQMIGVCCTLHNMFLTRNEAADPAWIDESKQSLRGVKGVTSSNNNARHEQQAAAAAAEVVIASAALHELEASEATSLARTVEPDPLLGYNQGDPDDLRRALQLRNTLGDTVLATATASTTNFPTLCRVRSFATSLLSKDS